MPNEQIAHSSIECGDGLAVTVKVALPPGLVATEELRNAVSLAADTLRRQADKDIRAVRGASLAADDRFQLVGLFGRRAIFVEPIENQYDSSSPRPWLQVTTAKGRIRLGWRKRVISISWDDSVIPETAEELFPNENTTKFDKTIHAWMHGEAREYIDTLLGRE
jgi:hypothetical protein